MRSAKGTDIDPDGWIFAAEAAQLMQVPTGRVRNWCRHRVFVPLTRKTGTGRWQVHRDLLEDRTWWAIVTGTRNSTKWSPAWAGERLTPRQQNQLIHREARAQNN